MDIDLKDKIIGVVMGGSSGEREVSLNSGAAVAKALMARGYTVKEVVVDESVVDQLRSSGVDVAFIVLHGGWGEDGRLQAVCETIGMPYTGSGVLASALAMNKAQAKAVFMHRNIPTPSYCPALSREFIMGKMGFNLPIVIKPSNEGSSLGVSIVRKEEEFAPALTRARQYDPDPIAEEYIPGREMSVGVLDGEALGVVEIKPVEGFYDYDHKYTAGQSRYDAPAEMPDGTARLIRDLGKAAYDALGCRGGARVDFRLCENRGPFVLEVNTIPGMTSSSLLPKSAAVMGIGFEELVERMLLSSKVHMRKRDAEQDEKDSPGKK